MADRLPIPDSTETLAFRAVCRVFKEDATLRRLGLTMIVWDGSANDLMEPVASVLPFMELQPSPNATGWSEADQHRSDFNINITLAIRGTNADDMLNLWGVVRSALFPDPANSTRAQIESLMTGAGVIQGTLTSQPFQVVQVDSGVRMLVGEGVLKLRINVTT